MRKALSLIELIFTIVIIAIVFTVIPKIVLSLNKADSFAIRQDAMLNGISMMMMISKLPWDANNTASNDILHVDSVYFDCNETTFMRDGGFVGGRTCENSRNASVISKNPEQNDIGDFSNTLVEANITASQKLYDLNITVSYIEDNDIRDLNSSEDVSNTTNLKRVHMVVYYSGVRGDRRPLTQFNYTSANLGQMQINSRVW